MARTAVAGILTVTVLLTAAACAEPVGRPRAAGPSVPGSASAEPFRAVRSLERRAVPVRLRIPAIAVDASVTKLGRLADGTVDVPHSWGVVGWYAGGPRPGEPGPAVLLGHVDSRAGPAVFARLGQLRPGDVAEVLGADGRTEQFRIHSVHRYSKRRFPTDEVYLPTLRPELRLVTCGGAFDRLTGHYVDNVIAFAELAG